MRTRHFPAHISLFFFAVLLAVLPHTVLAETLLPTSVTVTCPPTVTYDGTPQEPCTAHVSDGDTFLQSVPVIYGPNSDAGTVVASASFPGDAAHASSAASALFSITPRFVHIIPNILHKTYGDPDPTLTYSVSGLVGSDTEAILTGTLARDAGEDVGRYGVVKGTLSVPHNYDIAFTGTVFFIDQRPLTVTADDQEKGNGEPDPVLSYAITGGALQGSDAFSGTVTRDAGEDIGAYAITQGSLTVSDNYTFRFVPGTLNILPDSCSNIPGAQASAPTGTHISGTACVPIVTGGSGVGAGGGGGKRSGGTSSVSGQVLGATSCSPLLTDYLKFGWKNNADQVKKLQQFLNDQLHLSIPVTGFFGSLTRAGVQRFQKDNAEGIFAPWVVQGGFGAAISNVPTGFVYKTTRWKINNIFCPGSEAFPTVLN